jgi:dTDP-4-amino-4,6-dideoxygalactose transaminase
LIEHLKSSGIYAVFHYLSLHKSPYYLSIENKSSDLEFSDYYTDRLVRLPFFYELSDNDITYIISVLNKFFFKIFK